MHLKKNKKNKQRKYLNEHIPSPAQTICFSDPPPPKKKWNEKDAGFGWFSGIYFLNKFDVNVLLHVVFAQILYVYIRVGVTLVSIGLQMYFILFFRIKETWITLESLKEDCKSFENWVISIKLEIDSSASDQMDANFSKEKIQRYEVLLS